MTQERLAPIGAELKELIDAELRRPVPPAVTALARQLAERAGGAGGATAAVLFYGSALRDDALDGVLDFYVLIDRCSAWPGPRLVAFANRLLPPNVGYVEADAIAPGLRAKYAVMTVAQFCRGVSMRSVDTTLWARFSQPCACVHVRSQADGLAVREAVAVAVVTASRWAALLGPSKGEAVAFWRALYQRTYAAELRVERSARSSDLLSGAAPRYERLLLAAWRAAGVPFAVVADGMVAPSVDSSERARAERRWRLRKGLGRPLNLLRLLKAAWTFDNAIDYVAWKVERHSGYRIEPTPFQRRHPLLAAPWLYWRLRRRGVLR
ncbi:MAG: hypothetical protein Q7T97_10560 [Burkholderiaceae bacterium]|nr:hypothetical protein [Burkholderiaceae bacterium]